MQAILAFEMEDWRWFRKYVRPEDCLMKARKEGLHDTAAPQSSPDGTSDLENAGVYPGALHVLDIPCAPHVLNRSGNVSGSLSCRLWASDVEVPVATLSGLATMSLTCICCHGWDLVVNP